MTISTVFLLLLCASAHVATTSRAFRLELKHANPNLTMAERLSRAAASARRFASSGGVSLHMGLGEADYYVVEYGLGNPQQAVQAAVDITMNLVWTQCSTCLPRCFPQEHDYFNYTLSSTVYAVTCDEDMCADGYGYETQRCAGSDNGGMCAVRTNYDGGSSFPGALLQDDFTFGSATVYLAFGCFGETHFTSLNGPSGYIGLGRGQLSLVSQIGGQRFSYCFTRSELSGNPSPLLVGLSAGLGGNAPVISASLDKNPLDEPFSSFYYLSLTGMTVGETRLHIPRSAFGIRRVAPGVWAGGVVMFTGYPYTYLVDAAYMPLKQELSRQLDGSLLPPPTNLPLLELCVVRNGDVRVPPLVLHFGDGEDLTLPPENYWAPVDLYTSCMVVINAVIAGQLPWNETSMIGSYMQQDMHVLYDLDGEKIFFQPTDCTSI